MVESKERKQRAPKRFTHDSISKLKPAAATHGKETRAEYFDAGCSGLGLRVARNRGNKTVRTFFAYRRIGKERVRITLGTFPDMTLEQAHIATKEIVKQFNAGLDPRVEKKRIELEQVVLEESKRRNKLEGDANTFKAVCELFLKQYAHGKKTPLRAKTVTGYQWAFRHANAAGWELLPVSSITVRHVKKAIEAIEDKKHFAAARLLLAYWRKFFNWALKKKELIDFNPAQNIELGSTPADFKREHFLTRDELRVVFSAAEKLRAPFKAFVQILLLTGQRRGETALTKWSDLELDGPNPVWNIPKENTKGKRDHDVPLCPQALQIFTDLRATSGGQGYCFSISEKPGQFPLSGFSKLKDELDMRIKEITAAESPPILDPWRLHDLRHSCVTGMSRIGCQPHVVEAVVAHRSGFKGGVAGNYNHETYSSERRNALAAWAKHIVIDDEHSNVIILRGA